MKDLQIQTPVVCMSPANCSTDTCSQFGKAWEASPPWGRAPSSRALLAQAHGAGGGRSPRLQPLGLASCWEWERSFVWCLAPCQRGHGQTDSLQTFAGYTALNKEYKSQVKNHCYP